MSWDFKCLLLEVVVTSLIAEILLRFMSFKHVRRILYAKSSEYSSDAVVMEREALKVRSAIKVVSKILPFIKCYNKSLTAKIALERRHIPNELSIGFKKENGVLKGHAWLISNGIGVTGASQKEAYTINSVF